MHEGFLVHDRFKFFKWASALCITSAVAYAIYDPLDVQSGGTWLGYGLGTIGALLILWLMWFGIRKRRYGGAFRLRAWLSAHVYLGLSLIVVGTLHTGFQLGWNVHTLAYVLMMLVIASGAFGIYAYARYPRLMTENRRGQAVDEYLSQISDIDRECRQVAGNLPDEITAQVMKSCNETRIGGSCWRQLSGRDRRCASAEAFEELRQMSTNVSAGDGPAVRKLITLIGKKCSLLATVRRDIQLKALMDIWLHLHVPLSFALLAALTAHIFSVFYYW
ncbi:hypothetical protein NUH88_14595 [Nisaea acidiphila]|uniref:Ferric reductase like transmembrane component n=1 Tax=Nisaea acidiphila TaxID=1862145 RepID=A0A9J7ANY9_9PROT|nr:hypothetical protein [Nisaea acidiphila]UUX48634.1 hypothetical protein NUH88_14595 [Nisaea acidiphila]